MGGRKYQVKVVAYDDKYQANEAVTCQPPGVRGQGEVHHRPGGIRAGAGDPADHREEQGHPDDLGFTSKALAADKPHVPAQRHHGGSVAAADRLAGEASRHQEGRRPVPNDETGQQIAQDLDGAYRKAGAELSAKEFFERDRVDFVPLLTRMLARGIDAIELDGNSPATAGLIVKQARELGFTGRIVRTGGPATRKSSTWRARARPRACSCMRRSIRSCRRQAYAALYAAKYKHPMNGFSPAFYDGTNLLFEAMRRTGTVDDTDKVRAELERISGFQGALGTLDWTGKAMYGIDHQLNAPFYVAEVQDGKEIIRARCTVEGCR